MRTVYQANAIDTLFLVYTVYQILSLSFAGVNYHSAINMLRYSFLELLKEPRARVLT